jgi:hypothetical protein
VAVVAAVLAAAVLAAAVLAAAAAAAAAGSAVRAAHYVHVVLDSLSTFVIEVTM